MSGICFVSVLVLAASFFGWVDFRWIGVWSNKLILQGKILWRRRFKLSLGHFGFQVYLRVGISGVGLGMDRIIKLEARVLG